MNIAIDSRPINLYGGTGIGTYTENLVKNLFEIDAFTKDIYTLFWNGKNHEHFLKNSSKIIFTSKRQQGFFDKYYIPNYIEKNKIDIFHIPQNGMSYSENIPCKVVSTIHDIIPYTLPETVGKGYLKKFLSNMPKIIENSDAIITVSEFSKKDILKFFPGNDDKIFVTHLAANEEFFQMDKSICKNYLKEKYGIDFDFILYFGGFSKRKNIKFLIDSFSMIKNKNVKLILGGSLRSEGQNICEYVNKNNLQNLVIFPGFIENKDLPFFYNSSEIFVYPSLYEGFGLPPLEAMKCGVPVIASNSTSIPEILGENSLIINPHDNYALTKSINAILDNEMLKLDLIRHSLSRSSLFSWRKTAEKTNEIYFSFN